MATYKFSEPARHDVENIILYTIETWGKSQAENYFNGLEKQAQLLAEMPRLGKPLYEPYSHLRAFSYEQHILFFQEAPHGITIIRILHKNMSRDIHLHPDE